jgi:hypothetical protein
MSTDEYFFKEDKTELDKFLRLIAKRGYKNLWATDICSGEVRNISDYLSSVRKFSAEIPPYALAADGERVLPFWVYLGISEIKDTEAGKSIEVCIDYATNRDFHIKELHVCKWYLNDDSTIIDVTINPLNAKLPSVNDIWRFADRIDNMRKQKGLKYLDKKFSGDDIAIGKRLRKGL